MDKSQYVLPIEQPIVVLDANEAFDGLTDKEKLYVHYLVRASWIGGLITYLQTSPESGPIFVLFHKLFRKHSPNELRELAKKNGFTDDEVKAFYVYVCGVFSNAGNYKVSDRCVHLNTFKIPSEKNRTPFDRIFDSFNWGFRFENRANNNER